MILSDTSIKRLIQEKALVTGYVNRDEQVQSCGFDLTVEEIRVFSPASVYLDFSNVHRRIPDYERFQKLGFLSDVGRFMPAPCVLLAGGSSYVFQSNEYFTMPDNLMAFIVLRSSLMRAGMNVISAIVDPGYKGKLRFLVKTTCPAFIEENARFAQAVFMELDRDTARPYGGIFKGQK